MFLHLALVYRLAFVSGGVLDRGEEGREGAGGQTIEVEIAGDESEERPPLPGDVDSRLDEAAFPPDDQHVAVPVVRPLVRPAASDDDGPPEAVEAVEAASEAAPAATDPSVDGSGTEATVTDEGRAGGPDDPNLRALLEASVGGTPFGSRAGAIALFAEAARCPDPVHGTWIAHRYSPEFRDWARFTLRITRAGDDLRGSITTRMWRGLPSERRPPPCTAEGWDYTVEMTASGHVAGDHFDFGARSHRIARVDCVSPVFGYNPDHFQGTYDADADRLDTVNNDGGRDVDAPYTFRRSSCEP